MGKYCLFLAVIARFLERDEESMHERTGRTAIQGITQNRPADP
jgi:hypothetical protein